MDIFLDILLKPPQPLMGPFSFNFKNVILKALNILKILKLVKTI